MGLLWVFHICMSVFIIENGYTFHPLETKPTCYLMHEREEIIHFIKRRAFFNHLKILKII